MSEPALEVAGLEKRFGGAVALQDLSFTLAKGEFLTLLGPSGSGKSTTLRILAGLDRPDAGRVVMNGRDVVDLSAHARNIGMVFQDYALFPHMTVGENVGFPLEVRRVPRAEGLRRIDEMLEIVGLKDFASRYPRQLSGGQQQRVALARALVFNPDLVLLDEPLGALDKKLRGAMQAEILSIVRRLGATVICVTHDQEEALAMSDRIALFDAGRLVQIGAPEDLYARPDSAFVADFLGEANLLDGVLRRSGAEAAVVGEGWSAPVDEAPAGLPDGAKVKAMIRPEFIGIAAPDAAGPKVEAVLKDSVYLGFEYRLTLDLPGGTPLCVRCRDLAAAAALRPGQAVRLAWPKGAVRLLSA